MDLSDFDVLDGSNEGADLHLRGPNGQPLFQDDGEAPITITLLGEDSDVITKARNIQTNAYLRGGPASQMTAEVSRAQEIGRFAKATVRWNGIKVDGELLECTEANAKKLYADPRFPWIRDQVRAFIGDRARFLKGSQTG